MRMMQIYLAVGLLALRLRLAKRAKLMAHQGRHRTGVPAALILAGL